MMDTISAWQFLLSVNFDFSSIIRCFAASNTQNLRSKSSVFSTGATTKAKRAHLSSDRECWRSRSPCQQVPVGENWVVAFAPRARSSPTIDSDCSTTIAFCAQFPFDRVKTLGLEGCTRAATCCCLYLKSTRCPRRIGWIGENVSYLTSYRDSGFVQRLRFARWLKRNSDSGGRSGRIGKVFDRVEPLDFASIHPNEINSNESVDRHSFENISFENRIQWS